MISMHQWMIEVGDVHNRCNMYMRVCGRSEHDKELICILLQLYPFIEVPLFRNPCFICIDGIVLY